MISRILPRHVKSALRSLAGVRIVWGGNNIRPLPELRQVKLSTTCEAEALNNLFRLAQRITASGIVGDIVECGVYNGGSAAAIALGSGNALREIWLYDSFEGMPLTTPIDGEDAKAFIGQCVGSPEKVKEVFANAGLPTGCLEIRKGWFIDTFSAPLPEKIAFLHIDADWYDSVFLALSTFYDRVPDGGVIVLDDFGWWEGCREAFYEFCHLHKVKPLLERCGTTQAYWIKSRLHNRLPE